MTTVRRSFWSYFGYSRWSIISFYNFYWLKAPLTYYWLIVGLVSVAILGRLILQPHYFEIKGTRLIINRDFFSQDFVEIEDIDKIELQEGPFSKSRILLKNFKLGPYFNYYIVNNKDFKLLKKFLQLKVE